MYLQHLILHRFEESITEGLGKIRHSEKSQETKQRYCDGVLTDFRGKGVHFLQKPLTEPRNVKKIQPQKLPRSFFIFPGW